MADLEIDLLLDALKLPEWTDETGRSPDRESADRSHLAVRSDRAIKAATNLMRDLPRSRPGLPTLSGPDALAAARASADAGDVVAAADVLCGTLAQAEIPPVILLALAICAARLGRFQPARDFALVYLEGNPRHPRALCVLGLCELQNGNKAEAQGRLALAARLARGQAEFREDMRTAQKLLLIRHFGDTRGGSE